VKTLEGKVFMVTTTNIHISVEPNNSLEMNLPALFKSIVNREKRSFN